MDYVTKDIGARVSYEPGTVLEDRDEDRWTVQADGSARTPGGDYHATVGALDMEYGPLTVISEPPGSRTRHAETPRQGLPNVALMGRAGAGKDTAARLLAEMHGHVRVAFADPLKKMALAVDPIIDYVDDYYCLGDTEGGPERLSATVNRVGWEKAKRDYPEVRRFLQRLGAEGVRDTIGPDTWIDLAHAAVTEAWQAGHPAVLTDVRFPNEVEYARAHGFKLIWISRPGVAEGLHSSESAVSPADADVVIVNDGTVDELRASLGLVFAAPAADASPRARQGDSRE
jgi:hypothetical protein